MQENKDLAYKDYMEGMKYKDIAVKYNVSLATVKSWKTRYKWDRKSMHTKKEKVCIQNKAKININESISEDIEEVLKNNKLTDKQKLFCLYYGRCFNATQAYQKAYECDYNTANASGARLLAKVSIQEEIQKLKQGKFNRIALTEDDLLQKYIDIAFADIGNYVDFGVEEVKTEEMPYLKNYVRFKNGNNLDTSIISEISQGKDGARIKLHDKLKALEFVYDKIREDKIEERRLKLEKLKNEVENSKGSNSSDENTWVTNIMEVHKKRIEQIEREQRGL